MSEHHQAQSPGTNQAWRTCITSACRLAATSIYPLTSLTFMLMMWQRGELENITLEVPSEEEELDDDREPIVRYESEEEYKSYVLLLCSLSNGGCDRLARRVAKVEVYHMSLGVEVLFKQNPKLEQYLRESFDDKLVAKVCFFPSPRSQSADTPTASDVECCKEPARDAHQLCETGGIAVPSPV